MFKPRQQWSEAFFHLLLPRCGYSRHGSPVKGPQKRQDSISRRAIGADSCTLVPEFSSQLDGRLIRLCTAVRKENLPGRADDLDQFAGKFGLRSRVIEIRSVDQLSSLTIQRLDQSRMCMPESGDSNTPAEVQILFPVLIPHTGPQSANQNEIVPAVIGHNEFIEKLSGI